MRSFPTAASFVLLAVAAAAHADVVVPNSAAEVDADGSFLMTSTGTAGRTYQMSIAASQLTNLVGQPIVGLQWRLNGPTAAAWPASDASYAFWDVFIGPGVAPAAMSNTFANNFTGAPTQVRSGPLNIAAGSFTVGASPNAFGPALEFTNPYVYTGGDLLVEFRFAQQVGVSTQAPFDAVTASGGPANGWGVDFAARWTGNAAGVTGANGNFVVTNFVVPAPAPLAMLALALGVAARRRTRSH